MTSYEHVIVFVDIYKWRNMKDVSNCDKNALLLFSRWTSRTTDVTYLMPHIFTDILLSTHMRTSRQHAGIFLFFCAIHTQQQRLWNRHMNTDEVPVSSCIYNCFSFPFFPLRFFLLFPLCSLVITGSPLRPKCRTLERFAARWEPQSRTVVGVYK